MKDKGQLIDVLCGFKEKEDILYIGTMNDIINNKVLFIFDDGYVKNVIGSEYITRQKQTVATKLYNNKLLKVFLNTSDKKLVIKTNLKKWPC